MKKDYHTMKLREEWDLKERRLLPSFLRLPPAQNHSSTRSVPPNRCIMAQTTVFQVMTQRAGAPIFDVVIELTSENVDEWSIVRNVGGAVDALLSGRSYPVERRTRVNHDSRSAYKVR